MSKTPETALTYFNILDAFLINTKRELIKMDIIIKGIAIPAA
jgi:hypothetical protein